MGMPLVSARWTAFLEAMWACLNGICSEKQRPQSVTRQLGCSLKGENGCAVFFGCLVFT